MISREHCIPVGIGELKLAPKGSGHLTAYALGSCIGMTVWAPDIEWGGMLHIQLPTSVQAPHNLVENFPFRYADLAVPAIVKRLSERGANQRSFRVVIAGGARVGPGGDPFSVGARNVTAVRKQLWKLNIHCRAEDTLGIHPRTLRLDLNSGLTTICSNHAQTTH